MLNLLHQTIIKKSASTLVQHTGQTHRQTNKWLTCTKVNYFVLHAHDKSGLKIKMLKRLNSVFKSRHIFSN